MLRLAEANFNEVVRVVGWIYKTIEIAVELSMIKLVDNKKVFVNVLQFPVPIDVELKTQITQSLKFLPIATK